MKNHILILCILLCLFDTANSQTWHWGRQITTSGYGGSIGTTTDGSGRLIVTGDFSPPAIFGTDTVNLKYLDNQCFVAKVDTAGNYVWVNYSTGYSNSCFAVGNSVANDNNGNVVTTGEFQDSINFGGTMLPFGGNRASSSYNYFLVKYTAAGNFVWATEADKLTEINDSWVATDYKGNIYVAGNFRYHLYLGSYLFNIGSGTAPFLVKYSPGGTVLWATVGNSNGTVQAVCTDNTGNIYVTGMAEDTLRWNGHLLKTPLGASWPYIAKFDSSGIITWTTLGIGPTNSFAVPWGIVADGNSNIYQTGEFNDSLKIGSTQLKSAKSNKEIFVAKYKASNGNAEWAKQSLTGTNSGWCPYSISADNHNNIYIGCSTVNNPTDTLQYGSLMYYAKNTPACILKIDSAGNPVCGSIINNGCYPYGGEFVAVASDTSSRYVYEAATFASDTVFCKDTLISAPGGHEPYFARWGPIYKPTAVNEVKANSYQLIVYPNPSHGVFCFNITNFETRNLLIDVYNILGEKVYSAPVIIQASPFTLDLSSQPSGVYLYKLTDNGTCKKNGKLVIE